MIISKLTIQTLHVVRSTLHSPLWPFDEKNEPFPIAVNNPLLRKTSSASYRANVLNLPPEIEHCSRNSEPRMPHFSDTRRAKEIQPFEIRELCKRLYVRYEEPTVQKGLVPHGVVVVAFRHFPSYLYKFGPQTTRYVQFSESSLRRGPAAVAVVEVEKPRAHEYETVVSVNDGGGVCGQNRHCIKTGKPIETASNIA